MVKRLRATAIVLTFGMTLAFSGCIKKATYVLEPKPKDQVILRLADTFNADYPPTMGCIQFAKLVEKRTRGRIKIRIFENGDLGDETSAIEQVQFGGIDLARVNSALLLNYLQKYQSFLRPYIYRDTQDMFKALNGKIGLEFSNELLKEKVLVLCWYETGDYGFFNIKKEIKLVDDFNGLKLGVLKAQVLRDRVSGLGGTPVSVEPVDILSELQSKTIDGAQGNLMQYYLLNQYEIAKYFTIDQQAYIPDLLIGSRVSLMQLTKEDQEIIAKAAKDSMVLQRKNWKLQYEEAISRLKKAGTKIVFFNDGSKPRIRAITKNVYSGYGTEE